MGMSYELYWEGDPWLTEAYAEAHKTAIQHKSWELWLQGLYIHEAFGVVIKNAFSRKGTRPAKYMDEPIRVVPLSEAEKAEKTERERQRTIEYFNRLEKEWNKKQQSVPSATP